MRLPHSTSAGQFAQKSGSDEEAGAEVGRAGAPSQVTERAT